MEREGDSDRTARLSTQEIARRAEHWATTRELTVAGRNPWLVLVRTVRAAARDRISGLAAEMAFFALLSFVPGLVALGAGLGFLERIIGADPVARGQDAALSVMGTVFTARVTDDVLRPLVEGLLEERGGVALSGVAIAILLASRVFTATIRALDLAYEVEERRNMLEQRVLALLFAFGAIVVVSVMLVVSVVGPLLGRGSDLADQFGVGGFLAAAWSIGRWPLLFVVAVGFFAFVYRVGPNVRNTWRGSLPGATVGVLLWLAATLGLRVYLQTVGEPGAAFEAADEAVRFLGRVVGAVVAAMLWVFLSSLALLLGGELNSELARLRRRPAGGVRRLSPAARTTQASSRDRRKRRRG